MHSSVLLIPLMGAALVSFAACSDDEDLDSKAEARRAYLGFDPAIDRAIQLGFDGFNAATNANIPTQQAAGDAAGTMTIDGQVDQGASNNKEMRLLVTLADFSEGVVLDPDADDEEVDVFYNSIVDAPLALDLSLKNIPNGTFTGTMLGDLEIGGDIEATASFNLTLAGEIQEDPANADNVIRTPGTLTITGTVEAAGDTFDVDVTR
jgi:hypothetical protein